MNVTYLITVNNSENASTDDSHFYNEQDYTYTLLTIMISLLSFIGILGNIPVLIVFCKRKDRKASNTFIKVLAFIDLVVCAFVMPYSIVYEYHLVTSDIACRLFEFLIHFTIASSHVTLVAIATERYIAVCKIGIKLSVKIINRGMYGILLMSMFIAAPSIGTFAVVDDSDVGDFPCSFPHEITSGQFCHFTFAVMGKRLVKAYQIVQLVLFFIVLITIIILYSIIYTVLRRKTQIRKSLTRHRESSSTAERRFSVAEHDLIIKGDISKQEFASEIYPEEDNSNYAQVQQNSNDSNSSSELSKGNHNGYSPVAVIVIVNKDKTDSRVTFNDADVNSIPLKDGDDSCPKASKNNNQPRVSIEVPDKVKRKRTYHRRTAKMLFLCTVIYFVTWMPFWIDIFGLTNSLLLRYIFFVGNATNPIVYGIVNKQVRASFKRLFLTFLKSWCKGSPENERHSNIENISISGTSV